ncbi:MAG: 23S rRNA (guanosine(2251)-2'-O)-methyltransferase RlmB [Bacillota bacterium]|nr:23S rRNA (guanosine(2251)-2'-O)-methyltransferase RlmB [Bacillota bacterium]
MTDEFIPGRNAVLEALRSGRSINKIFMAEGKQEGVIRQITALAKVNQVPISHVPAKKLTELYDGNHQGVIAAVAPRSYVEVEDILTVAKERQEDPFVVILAAIESPQNLGAIMRTAEIAGVHGIIIPKNNSVGLNATVAKISAGASEYMPVARVTNLTQAVQFLQEQGLWIYGADMEGTTLWHQDMKGPMALIIGGEDKGIPRLLLKNCDFKVSIPMKGKIPSLNASAAAAVMIYEVMRQRWTGR